MSGPLGIVKRPGAPMEACSEKLGLLAGRHETGNTAGTLKKEPVTRTLGRKDLFPASRKRPPSKRGQDTDYGQGGGTEQGAMGNPTKNRERKEYEQNATGKKTRLPRCKQGTC